MGVLRHRTSGRTVELESDTSVGRSPRSVMTLAFSFVSGQHASVRWAGEAWEVRDLGSRNGTWVNDRPVTDGASAPLPAGARVSFGSLEETWELVDGSPPRPMIRPVLGGAPLILDGTPVSLPSEECTLASVFWDDGAVRLETDSERRDLQDGEVFEVSGVTYSLVLPRAVPATTHAASRAKLVRECQLAVSPSQNEEHVALALTVGGKTHELRARVHNYLLLLLARQRLADREAGVGPDEEGWIVDEDVCRQLQVDRQRLNTDIFRIRKQFGEVGLVDPTRIIERRPDSRELRLGVRDVAVASDRARPDPGIR